MKIPDSNIAVKGQQAIARPLSPGKGSKDSNPEMLKLKKACRDFESIFISYMLKSMRKASEKSNLFGEGLGSEIYGEIFDGKLAEKMAETGQMKIGDVLYNQYAPLIKAKKPDSLNMLVVPTKLKHAEVAPVNGKPIELKPQPAKSSTQSGTAIPDKTGVAISLAPTDKLPAESSKHSKSDRSIGQDHPGQAVLAKFEDSIAAAAAKFGLNPALIKAVIKHESGGDPNAVSHAGAKGLMQLIDSTAKMMGVIDPFNPIENIMGGAKYLAQLIERFGGDLKKALASYNAGPGAVEKFNGVPPYKETKDYVQKVLATFEQEKVGS